MLWVLFRRASLYSLKETQRYINTPHENPTCTIKLKYVQSNLNGSNIFGTMENCSRHALFEQPKVNHGSRSGSK